MPTIPNGGEDGVLDKNPTCELKMRSCLAVIIRQFSGLLVSFLRIDSSFVYVYNERAPCDETTCESVLLFIYVHTPYYIIWCDICMDKGYVFGLVSLLLSMGLAGRRGILCGRCCWSVCVK